MPRRPSRLANCYVPLRVPSTNPEAKDEPSLSSSSSSPSRTDGRQGHELRQIVLETSVLSKNQALGSALVELGHTKVLGEIHLVAGTSNDNNRRGVGGGGTADDGGSLLAVVKFAPHIGVDQIAQRAKAVSALDYTPLASDGRMRQETSLNEAELSRQLTAALNDVIPLGEFPKTILVVNISVLQDDGSCLSAAITAATLALLDAKVEIYDLVTSCTVAVMRPITTDSAMCEDNDDSANGLLYLADPTQEEAERAQAVICLAMTPNHKDVTLWSQSGRLSSMMANQAMDLCRDGCRSFHKLLREAIILKANPTIS